MKIVYEAEGQVASRRFPKVRIYSGWTLFDDDAGGLEDMPNKTLVDIGLF